MDGKGDEKLQNSLKFLVRTSAIVLMGVILAKILGYVFRILIARYYGPESYGLFSLAIVISGWFIAVSSLGLLDGMLRFIPLYRGKKEIEKIRHLVRFGTGLVTITSFIAGLIMFFTSEIISTSIFHEPALEIYLKIFSIVVPLANLSSVYLRILRAYEQISWYSFISNVLQNAVRVIAIFILIALGIKHNALSISYILGTAAILLVAYLICTRKLSRIFFSSKIKKNQKKAINSEVMKYSLPLMFFGIVSTVFFWIDSFSIGYFRGALEVGFYNAAAPIAALLTIVPELFMQLFFPMITQEYSKRNFGLISELSKQVSKWILIVNLPMFVVLLVFPGAVINLFFGSEYLIAENALRILAIGGIISSISVVSTNLVSVVGKSRAVLLNIVIASVINFFLNALFVPMEKIWFMNNEAGLTGAALATLISVIIFNLLFIIQTYKYLKIVPFRRKMGRLIFSAAISAVLLIYLRNTITSNNLLVLSSLTAFFVIIYSLLILALRALDRNDIDMLKVIRNKIPGTLSN